MSDLRTIDLVVRGYARYDRGVWYAVCLDLCLAAQGDSCKEAMDHLVAQIQEYVYDAVAGEDKEHVMSLLKRPAPLSQWLIYYWYNFLANTHVMRDGFKNLMLPLPLPLEVPHRTT